MACTLQYHISFYSAVCPIMISIALINNNNFENFLWLVIISCQSVLSEKASLLNFVSATAWIYHSWLVVRYVSHLKLYLHVVSSFRIQYFRKDRSKGSVWRGVYCLSRFSHQSTILHEVQLHHLHVQYSNLRKPACIFKYIAPTTIDIYSYTFTIFALLYSYSYM